MLANFAFPPPYLLATVFLKKPLAKLAFGNVGEVNQNTLILQGGKLLLTLLIILTNFQYHIFMQRSLLSVCLLLLYKLYYIETNDIINFQVLLLQLRLC